jgi:simple sugar transport system permease protein
LQHVRTAALNAGAAAIGLGLGFVLVLLTGADPFVAINTLLVYPVSDPYNAAEVLIWFTALLIIAQGIALGIRANLWNVGAEGQFLIGSIMTLWAYKQLANQLPHPLVVVAMIAAGIAGGAVWALTPGVIKARYGGNEIVVTLLLNLVAVSVLWWALDGPIRGRFSAGYPLSDVIAPEYGLPVLLPGTRLNAGLLFAIAVALLFYLLAERTHFGYSVRAVGSNYYAAVATGIRVQRVIVLTMLIAGAAAGLAGALHVMGVLYRIDAGYAETGFGYLAIAVAMLGGAHPIGVVFSSAFFSFIMIGSQAMQRAIQVPFPIVYAVVGIMLISLTTIQRTYRRTV